MSEPAFLSVPDVARMLAVSDDLVYDLIERGEIPSTRLGRRKVVPRRAIELVLERAMANFDPDRLLVALASAEGSSTTNTSACEGVVEGSPRQAGAGASVLADVGRR
jgi:excisionase family DNA binding protein